MGNSEQDRWSDRQSQHHWKQLEFFDKSCEGRPQDGRDRSVECLGLIFENEDARRIHFLDRLRRGLEELQASLGSVPYIDIGDAIERMTAIKYWPLGGKDRLKEIAERMGHADPSKDLLQRWKDEVGFPPPN